MHPSAEKVKRSCHCTILILTFGTIILTPLNVLCFAAHFTTAPNKDFGEAHAYIFAAWVMFFIGYWRDCYKSASSQYLKNKMSIHQYENFVSDLKRAPPQIGTKIECFRYTGAKGTEYYTDAQGRKRNRPKDYDEKTTIFSGTSYFDYSSWKDESGEVEGALGKGLIKLEIEKVHRFGDEKTAKLFAKHQEEYSRKNKMGPYWEEETVLDISGHLQYVLVENQGCFTPCCVGIAWFYIWSFFFLSWPYRIWFELAAKPRRITISKVIYAQQDEEKVL